MLTQSTPQMLIQIFSPYQIASSKILRDSNGNSRGVGFARYEALTLPQGVSPLPLVQLY